MAQLKLTRSPSLTYIWMAISILVVVVLFRRWDILASSRQRAEWWMILGAFLLADYLFLIVPIRDRKSIRRLRLAGKLWALVAWLSVAAFVYTATQGARLSASLLTNVQVTALGLLLLALLVYAIFRLSKQWRREALRSIVARTGGGFLVHFHPDAEIAAVLSLVPGAQPGSSHTDSGPQDWSVPASPVSAAALLQLAKRFDFDFVPQRTATEDLEIEKGFVRGR